MAANARSVAQNSRIDGVVVGRTSPQIRARGHRQIAIASSNDRWQVAAAYLYVLHLDSSSLAWEYLRRNPDYRRQWERARRTADAASSAWLLAALEDPRLDARIAQPLWKPQPRDVLRLARGPSGPSSQPFGLWRMRGRKALYHDGSCLVLENRVAGGTLRIVIADELAEGEPFAYLVCADALAEHRLRQVRRCQALMEHREPGNAGAPLARPDRVAVADMRSLQALDGVLAGASQRDVATAIFGYPRVNDEWSTDGSLRAQIRHLIRRGREFVNGGYARLITGETLQRTRAGSAGGGGR